MLSKPSRWELGYKILPGLFLSRIYSLRKAPALPETLLTSDLSVMHETLRPDSLFAKDLCIANVLRLVVLKLALGLVSKAGLT